MVKEKYQGRRWVLLAAAVFSMMLIGLYQYSWSMFVTPVRTELKLSLEVTQLTFTLFTWIMTWTQPLAGFIYDKKDPKLFGLLGGALAGIGWIAASFVDTASALYLTYGLGSIGVGILYALSVSLANRWFPDRRGLATGLVAFGYGFGAAVFNPIISWIIASLDFRAALAYLGAFMLLVLPFMGLVLRYPLSKSPKRMIQKASKIKGIPHQFELKEMVKTPQWWIIYTSFALTATTGLMIAAQLSSMSEAFNLSNDFFLAATVTFPVMNGLGRIFGGWVSDKIGREVTMTMFFASSGFLSLLLLIFGSIGIAFVIIVSFIGLLWGPIFTFFPSIIADYYGRDNSTSNYGLTYTAKAWGGLLGGYVIAWLAMAYEGFTLPILISAIFSFIAASMVFPKVLRNPQSTCDSLEISDSSC